MSECRPNRSAPAGCTRAARGWEGELCSVSRNRSAACSTIGLSVALYERVPQSITVNSERSSGWCSHRERWGQLMDQQGEVALRLQKKHARRAPAPRGRRRALARPAPTLMTLSMPLSLGGPPHPARTRAHGHVGWPCWTSAVRVIGDARFQSHLRVHGDQVVVDISTQITFCFGRCFSVPF